MESNGIQTWMEINRIQTWINIGSDWMEECSWQGKSHSLLKLNEENNLVGSSFFLPKSDHIRPLFHVQPRNWISLNRKKAMLATATAAVKTPLRRYFTVSELEKPSISVSELLKTRGLVDFQAPKSWSVRSCNGVGVVSWGNSYCLFVALRMAFVN